MASDFVKALTNTFVYFSFAYVNIRQPVFGLAADISIWVNQNFMQIRGIFKKFWASMCWTKTLYCLYISKRYLPCVFVWADRQTDVIV